MPDAVSEYHKEELEASAQLYFHFAVQPTKQSIRNQAGRDKADVHADQRAAHNGTNQTTQSHKCRDSFVIKQLMVLLSTYYVKIEEKGKETKIYILNFFKHYSFWKDI